MKKNVAIALIALLLAVSTVLVFSSKKTKGEKYIKVDNKLYEKAVNYLEKDLEEDENKDKEGYKTFITYDGFGMTKKGKTKYAYMWILEEGYYLKDERPELSHGSSMFYKFTFRNNKVVKYEVPEDGGDYKKSVKDMCPDGQMADKVLNYELKISNDEKVNEYYK